MPPRSTGKHRNTQNVATRTAMAARRSPGYWVGFVKWQSKLLQLQGRSCTTSAKQHTTRAAIMRLRNGRQHRLSNGLGRHISHSLFCSAYSPLAPLSPPPARQALTGLTQLYCTIHYGYSRYKRYNMMDHQNTSCKILQRVQISCRPKVTRKCREMPGCKKGCNTRGRSAVCTPLTTTPRATRARHGGCGVDHAPYEDA